MTPHAWLAVHLAEAMVQQHIGRTRGRWRGVGSDDGIESEERLDLVAFEPAVEIVACRFGEEIQQHAAVMHIELRQAIAQLAGPQQFGQRAEPAIVRDIRGRLENEVAQNVCDRIDFGTVGVEPRSVRTRAS